MVRTVRRLLEQGPEQFPGPAGPQLYPVPDGVADSLVRVLVLLEAGVCEPTQEIFRLGLRLRPDDGGQDPLDAVGDFIGARLRGKQSAANGRSCRCSLAIQLDVGVGNGRHNAVSSILGIRAARNGAQKTTSQASGPSSRSATEADAQDARPGLITVQSDLWCAALSDALRATCSTLHDGLRYRDIQIHVGAAQTSALLSCADAGGRGEPYRDLTPVGAASV